MNMQSNQIFMIRSRYVFLSVSVSISFWLFSHNKIFHSLGMTDVYHTSQDSFDCFISFIGPFVHFQKRL